METTSHRPLVVSVRDAMQGVYRLEKGRLDGALLRSKVSLEIEIEVFCRTLVFFGMP